MNLEQDISGSPSQGELRIDPLTGASHYKAFLAEIEHRMASNHVFKLLMFNIMRFQYFNGCCGHHEGDRFLQKAANAIAKVMPPGMPVFRIGGDDFAVFSRDDDQTALLCLAETVRAAIEEIELPPSAQDVNVPFHRETDRPPILSLAASSAIVQFPRDFDSIETAQSVMTEALHLSCSAAPFSCLVYKPQQKDLLCQSIFLRPFQLL